MPKSIVISEVIALLDITLDRNMPSVQADKIVAVCIGLLRGEYNKLIGE